MFFFLSQLISDLHSLWLGTGWVLLGLLGSATLVQVAAVNTALRHAADVIAALPDDRRTVAEIEAEQRRVQQEIARKQYVWLCAQLRYSRTPCVQVH